MTIRLPYLEDTRIIINAGSVYAVDFRLKAVRISCVDRVVNYRYFAMETPLANANAVFPRMARRRYVGYYYDNDDYDAPAISTSPS